MEIQDLVWLLERLHFDDLKYSMKFKSLYIFIFWMFRPIFEYGHCHYYYFTACSDKTHLRFNNA